MHVILFTPVATDLTLFIGLLSPLVRDIVHIQFEEDLYKRLQYQSQVRVVFVGRPVERASMLFRAFQEYPDISVICVAPGFLPPDISMSEMFSNLRLLKFCASGEIPAELMHSAILMPGHKQVGYEHAMKDFQGFIKEVNYRTQMRVMSEKYPESLRKVLPWLLAGYELEDIARALHTGVRQIWLAERLLKHRWGVPGELSLPEALLLCIDVFHSDENITVSLSKLALNEDEMPKRLCL